MGEIVVETLTQESPDISYVKVLFESIEKTMSASGIPGASVPKGLKFYKTENGKYLEVPFSEWR